MKHIVITCPHCGLTALGKEASGKRRVHVDRRAVYCSVLFEQKRCSYWDRAVSEAWLRKDGLLPSQNDD